MNNKQTIAAAVSLALIVSGCATTSKSISASYTSPNQYSTYDCQQLAAEGARIQARVVQLGGRLDEAANNDAAIMAVGLILFWPVLFALGGTKSQEADYARLKGEYEAVEAAAVAKKCAHAANTTTALGPATAPATPTQPTPLQDPAVVQAVYVPPPGAVATAPSPPTKVAGIGGESKYMFSAEQYAKANGCTQAVATMVVRQAFNETFSVDCQGKDTIMVRCEAGTCRSMQ